MKWKVGIGSKSEISSLSEVEAGLLHLREVDGDADGFFSPQYDQDIHDPSLIFGISDATQRIYRAIEKREKVVVYGDYDVDGITSTAILVSTLRELGLDAVPFLPHRSDHGYGLNHDVLAGLVEEIDLLITVDCGISNADEVRWLNQAGVETIITDHHEIPQEMPDALAVIHPRHPRGSYPFGQLCGAAVSWKLATSLLRDKRSPFSGDKDKEKWLLDLVCLGTVADMMPLTGENRALVKFGLDVLKLSRRPGIKALLSEVHLQKLDEEAIGYRIAPLLNAAGRMDHPQPALDLLMATNEDEASKLLDDLKKLNRERRSLSKKICEVVEEHHDGRGDFVFAWDKSWKPGVVGLVAGRLSRTFDRPAFVIGGNGDMAVGSARAPEGVNVLAAVEAGSQYLKKFGGHAGAAGFSLSFEKINDLQRSLDSVFSDLDITRENLTGVGDMVIAEQLLNEELAYVVGRFAPYGEGNPRPCFVIRSVMLAAWRFVGKNHDHVKFTFRAGDEVVDGIGFGLGEEMRELSLETGQLLDILGFADINEFRGRKRFQLLVQSVAISGEVELV